MRYINKVRNHNHNYGSTGRFQCDDVEPDIIQSTLTSAGFEVDIQQRTSHAGNLVTTFHIHKANKRPRKGSRYHIDYYAFEQSGSVWQALLSIKEIAAQVQVRLNKAKREDAFEEAIFRHWKATGKKLTRQAFLEMYEENGQVFDPIAYYDEIPSIALENARALSEQARVMIDNIRAEGILNGNPVSPDELQRKLKNGD